MNLKKLGWNPFFESHFEQHGDPGLRPARVLCEHRNLYEVASTEGAIMAEVTGNLRHKANSRADFPTVGDWVAIADAPGGERAVIHTVLPRKSVFSRKAVLGNSKAGQAGALADEQVLAANIDYAFLVTGLDGNFNVRRIERYVAIGWDSGAQPVIILNKADLCDDLEERLAATEEVAIGVDVHAVSAARGEGFDALDPYLQEGRTVAFLGSSGVGKSTMINRLLGEDRQVVHDVREGDSRGRHTTTSRELVVLPEGGIVIDTPGLREIQAWSDSEGLSRTFGDIEGLIGKCRFSDCHHQSEPGCAVRAALEDGSLDAGRYRSYLKLQKELRHLEMRQDNQAARQTQREFARKIRRYHQDMKALRKKGLA